MPPQRDPFSDWLKPLPVCEKGHALLCLFCAMEERQADPAVDPVGGVPKADERPRASSEALSSPLVRSGDPLQALVTKWRAWATDTREQIAGNEVLSERTQGYLEIEAARWDTCANELESVLHEASPRAGAHEEP